MDNDTSNKFKKIYKKRVKDALDKNGTIPSKSEIGLEIFKKGLAKP